MLTVKHSQLKKVNTELKPTLRREIIKSTTKDMNGFVRIDPRFVSAC